MTVVVGVAPAQANGPNCTSPHCYSIARSSGSYSGVSAGYTREFTSINVALGDGGAHINSEIWLALSNGHYLETGIRNGNDSGAQSGGCGCVAYDIFWAQKTISPVPVEKYYVIQHASPDQQWDNYAILRSSTTDKWNILFNSAMSGTTANMGTWTASAMHAGGEFENTNCSANAGVADTFDMLVDSVSLGGTYQLASWNQSSMVETDCGMVGSSSGAGSWSWSRHGV